MKWIETKISTTPNGVSFVETVLVKANIAGWQVKDENEMKKFFYENPRVWDYIDENIYSDPEVFIIFYVADNAEGKKILDTVMNEIGELRAAGSEIELGALNCTHINVNDEDWADNWKKYFKPIEIGKKIVIKPEWETYKSNDGNKKIIMTINPGSMFGTGQHETTRLCLEAIEKYTVSGATVLDLGCGSGILSIISLLLGAEECTAVDFDPGAEEIVSQNALLNGITGDRLKFLFGDIIKDFELQKRISIKKYDRIIANITADAIISIIEIFGQNNLLAPGGLLILSGIINNRIGEVKDIIEVRYKINETISSGDWICLICRNFL